MKSANVTGLPIQSGEMGIAPQRTVAKQGDENKPVSFKDLMNRSIADGTQVNGARDRGKTVSVREPAKDQQASVSPKSPDKDNMINKTEDRQPVSKEMQENAKSVAGDLEEAVKEEVAEELGISEEELEEAMEVLGLSYMELLDPANLQQLLDQVAEEIPAIAEEVLVLVPEDMIKSLEDVMAPILQQTDLTPEEMNYLLTEVLPTGESAVAESFSDILDKADIPADMMAPKGEEQLTVPVNPVPVRPMREADSAVRVITIVDEEPEVSEPVPEQPKAEAAVPIDEEQEVQTVLTEAGQPAEEIPQENAAVADQTAQPANPNTTVNTASKVSETDNIEEPRIENTVVSEEITAVTVEEGLTEDSGSESDMMGQSRTADTHIAADAFAQAANQAVGQVANFAETMAAQAADTTMPYTTVDAADIIDQLVTNAQATITEEVTRMEIELNPQTLGRMIMQVQSNSDGVVTARLITQNEAVSQALESQMNLLRESLNNRGIRIEAVEVAVGTHEFERSLEEGQQQAGEYEQQGQAASQGRRTRNLHRGELDELQGLMTEEEELAARIMRDSGNTLNYQA